MVKKTVSKSKFAEMAGVSAAAVTKACKKSLAAALVGKHIDVDHEAAKRYCNQRDRGQSDELFEEAFNKCSLANDWSKAFLQRELRIGHARATKLCDALEKHRLDSTPSKQPTPRVVSGQEAARQTKKNEAQSRLSDAVQSNAGGTGEIIHDTPNDIRDFRDMTLRELIDRFGTDVAFVDWLKATKEIELIKEKQLKNAQTEGDLVSRNLVKIGIVEPIDAAHIKLLTDGAKTIARRSIAMHGAGRELGKIEEFVKDQISSFIRPVKAKVKKALKNA